MPRPGAPGPRSRCPRGARRRGTGSSRRPLTALGRAYCGAVGWDSAGARARARGCRSVSRAPAAPGSRRLPAGTAGLPRSWGRLAPGGRAGGRPGAAVVLWGYEAVGLWGGVSAPPPQSPRRWAVSSLQTDPAGRVVCWVCCRVKGVVAAETALLNTPDGNLRVGFEG